MISYEKTQMEMGDKKWSKNSKKQQRIIKITIIKDDRGGNLPLKLYMMMLGNGQHYSYYTT